MDKSWRLPFSYRLLLAFAVPLVIWLAVSVAVVFAFQQSEQRNDELHSIRETISLARDYRHTIPHIREEERSYLLTSSPEYFERHAEAMRRAMRIQGELRWKSSPDDAQLERLDRAAETLQEWFYEVSTRRMDARRALPLSVVIRSEETERLLLSSLLVHLNGSTSIPDKDLDDLHKSLEALKEYASDKRYAAPLTNALDLLDDYQAAIERGDVEAATSGATEIGGLAIPITTFLIEQGYQIYASVDPDEEKLVARFEDEMGNFVAGADEKLAAKQKSKNTMASIMQWVLWVGMALAVIAMVFTTLWFARRIGRSIESIDQATEELARGNLMARAESGRHDRLIERFNVVAELIEKRNREAELLSELNETLHNCRTTQEALSVFGQFSRRLFPTQPGVLYFIDPNGRDVAAVSAWSSGEKYSSHEMTMEDCWALRLGRAHENGKEGNVRCEHLSGECEDSLCVPLPAFGELIGMLFVTLPANQEETERERQRQFVTTVAEQVALAISNVKLREKLKHQSIRDPLTQLFNRRQMDEVMDREMHRAERHSQPLSVLALDIDHFKDFNDLHGHDGGDAVLKQMGELLQDFFRPEDSVFRTGGEEFLAVLPSTHLEDAAHRAETLRKHVSHMRVRHGASELPPVTISVGVATFPDSGATSDEVLKSADKALYEAKRGGRNRVISAGQQG